MVCVTMKTLVKLKSAHFEDLRIWDLAISGDPRDPRGLRSDGSEGSGVRRIGGSDGSEGSGSWVGRIGGVWDLTGPGSEGPDPDPRGPDPNPIPYINTHARAW